MHIISYLLSESVAATTIEDVWGIFEIRILSGAIPKQQKEALKLAFLCGAAGTMSLLQREIVKMTEEEAAAYVASLIEELKESTKRK